MKKIYVLTIFFFLVSFHKAWSQATFISNITTGSWNAVASWSIVSGTDADGLPDMDDDVYIQSGHTITLTQAESCNNLNVSTGTTSATVGSESVLQLASFTLSINGSLRCYFATLGTTPGTSTNSIGAANIVMAAGGGGKLKFIGNTRNITNATEWAAGNTGSTTAFGIEIAMNAGQTATMGSSIKASTWLISSGTVDAGTNRLAADIGAATGSDITIASGATLISTASGSGTNAVIGRTASGLAGTLNLNGAVILRGPSPSIAVTTINVGASSSVTYDRTGTQTLIAAINSGAAMNIYNNIIFGGTNIKTLAVNTTVNSLLSLQGTATVAAGSFTLGTLTLEYAGSSAQTSTNVEFPTITGPTNLIINNANGVILHAPRTITGNLELTNGLFKTTATNLFTLDVSATYTGGSAVSFVAGPLARNTNTVASYTFPVGAGSTFRSVDVIPNATTTSNYIAQYFNVGQGSVNVCDATRLDAVATNEYWDIAKNSGADAQITLKYNGATTWSNGTPDASKFITVGHVTDGCWKDETGSTIAGNAASGSVTSSTISSFSPFGFAYGPTIVLPINLTSFTALKTNTGNIISWTTENAINFSHFEIECQTEGQGFKTIGKISIDISNKYTFIDNQPLPTTNYYRLKMVDKDGSFSYSKTVAIVNANNGFVISSVYPTITKGSVFVEGFSSINTNVVSSIYNLSGQKLLEQKDVANQAFKQTIDFSKLTQGVYILKLYNGINESTYKIIKQ